MTATAEKPESGSLNIINLDKFKQCVLFSISIQKWGNRAQIRDMNALQAYLEQMKAEPDPDGEKAPATVTIAGDRVKSSKVLIKSKVLDNLVREMTEIKAACLQRAMPSYFRAGMFVIRQDQVSIVENDLRVKLAKLMATEPNAKGELGAFEAFIAAYPAAVEYARNAGVKKGGLGPLFRQADYPSVEQLRKLFGIEWYWLALSVPENIPDELKAEAGEKFKRRLMDAASDIENALRVEFQELLKHAEERLTQAPGEKPKTFRDSLIGNLVGFIETFEGKNVFGDDRLAGVVAQAKAALLDEKGDPRLTAKKLREFASIREEAKKRFAAIRTELDGMIEEKAERRFDLTED